MIEILIELKQLKYAALIAFLLVGLAAFSQKVVEVHMSDCARDSYPAFMHPHRLIQKELKNDTLNLQIGIVRNCSFTPKIENDYRGDSLILNIGNSSKDYTACDCCFELTLRVVGISDTNFRLVEKWNVEDFIGNEFKEWIVTREFNYYQNKFIFPTLEEVNALTAYNLISADSLKVGLWYQTSLSDPNSHWKIFYIIDESGKSRTKWAITYNGKKEITEVVALSGINDQGVSDMQVNSGKEYLKLIATDP